MIKEFENLTEEEYNCLLKAPVLVSVLASCSYKVVNESQKADAIKLSHLKTYTANPVLIPYYEEVEKHFKMEFDKAVEKYYPFNACKREELIKDIEKTNAIISKLNQEYASGITRSLNKYAAHVKKARHSIFQDFIFPLPIDGLSN